MNDDLAARTLAGLRHTAPYCDLRLTDQPVSDLQQVLNTVLVAMRLPLYHRRLGRPAPPDRAYDAAEQQGLAILAAFASAAGVRQAILRADGSIVRSVSFQPRPEGLNWTAEYAIAPIEKQLAHPISAADVLHLAVKVMDAALRCQWFHAPAGTGTFIFERSFEDAPSARFIFKDVRGQAVSTAHLR